ncbi:ABC transporter ATP-binding protein [Rhizobiaceae bacterium BDR2-2]|uniref:ABC transporter ATP-binding protein n=1 Tax=Ectorhizobium quercum TaxID=2965071 RepID=A0AAE3MYL5_9HYPH|nr:ABC transporter ATP-binding protein [Ectorhizobium quercum]MCX8997354.1 ABC transporter ATP-binding protein [Ectorhizobium quercum]
MHSVELDKVSMVFGATRAVDDVSFTVGGGEFFSILGPSGCGKTTILRMIAGFLEPTAGRVSINGKDMKGLGPDRRPTAMIFQSLALFPLMPVWENIAFGLEARGVPKARRREKAEELLELIALKGYGDRLPGALSGGQRQRVAIARALAIEPQVLLLDEPLSALDLKLRQHMRAELRALQKRTGVTFIYITHDQSEALAMSDRIAVMNAGALEQVGTPRELYDSPATPFIATFVGENNAIPGKVTDITDGVATLESAAGRLRGRAGPDLAIGQSARLYVRPEALVSGSDGENSLSARIDRIDFEGAFALAYGKGAGDAAVVAAITSTALSAAPPAGEVAQFSFSPEHATVLADV